MAILRSVFRANGGGVAVGGFNKANRVADDRREAGGCWSSQLVAGHWCGFVDKRIANGVAFDEREADGDDEEAEDGGRCETFVEEEPSGYGGEHGGDVPEEVDLDGTEAVEERVVEEVADDASGEHEEPERDEYVRGECDGLGFAAGEAGGVEDGTADEHHPALAGGDAERGGFAAEGDGGEREHDRARGQECDAERVGWLYVGGAGDDKDAGADETEEDTEDARRRRAGGVKGDDGERDAPDGDGSEDDRADGPRDHGLADEEEAVVDSDHADTTDQDSRGIGAGGADLLAAGECVPEDDHADSVEPECGHQQRLDARFRGAYGGIGGAPEGGEREEPEGVLVALHVPTQATTQNSFCVVRTPNTIRVVTIPGNSSAPGVVWQVSSARFAPSTQHVLPQSLQFCQ